MSSVPGSSNPLISRMPGCRRVWWRTWSGLTKSQDAESQIVNIIEPNILNTSVIPLDGSVHANYLG